MGLIIKDEELDDGHIYCPHCREVIFFNLKSPAFQMGRCKKCQTLVQETKPHKPQDERQLIVEVPGKLPLVM